jgi:hypothetical protein
MRSLIPGGGYPTRTSTSHVSVRAVIIIWSLLVWGMPAEDSSGREPSANHQRSALVKLCEISRRINSLGPFGVIPGLYYLGSRLRVVHARLALEVYRIVLSEVTQINVFS